MSVYSGFSTRGQENYYDGLCISLIVSLSQRVLHALKNEICDDLKFSKTITSIYKKLVEVELHKYIPPKVSECFTDLASFCSKSYSIRSNSTESKTQRGYTPDKSFTSKTPNLSFLDKIIEEVPKLNKSTRKYHTRKKNTPRIDSSNHPYYESIMGKYLKMSLKSPLRNSTTSTRAKPETKQVQLTDGMFFRLF